MNCDLYTLPFIVHMLCLSTEIFHYATELIFSESDYSLKQESLYYLSLGV
jgi:hypothetical protein